MREAYSHEVSSAGFWAGDDRFPEAAFYSYAYPTPAGFSSGAFATTGATVLRSGGRNVTLWGRVTISSSGAGSRIRLSGHTTIDTFGNRSQICDQLYPRGTPTPIARRASP